MELKRQKANNQNHNHRDTVTKTLKICRRFTRAMFVCIYFRFSNSNFFGVGNYRLLHCSSRFIILDFCTEITIFFSIQYTLAPSRVTNITASSNLLFEDIYLKCEVQGNPLPDVWWTRESIPRFRVANSSLVIHRAEISDIGTYYCHARNNLHYVNVSFDLNLIGRFFTFY